MDAALEGRRALVVGGTSGIGLAIAEALVAEGARVAVAGRRDLPGPAGAVAALRADISDERQINRMVDQAVAELGGLDLFVNSAARRENGLLVDLDTAAYERTIATTLTGCVLCCRAVVPHLRRGIDPAIVIVGSTATKSTQLGETAYRAAKAGLQAHAEVLAVELASAGVRVNLLTPGAVDTAFVADFSPEARARSVAQIPLHREATPGEIAPAAVFLLSSRLAGYITGAELVVDGGLQRRPLNLP
jgi:3-oxoacyl-[acyl-carrier protein] reductase